MNNSDTERSNRSKRARKSSGRFSLISTVLAILKNIFVWLTVLAAVSMMVFTIVSVTTFDRNDRNLFGYKAFIVRSDSMSATDFDSGDLVLIQEVDPSTLKQGDIIAYQSTAPENFGETVTHKIRSLIKNEDGTPAFITYGTTTGSDDPNPVTYEHILGKYSRSLPGIGTFFAFLKTTPGYILCIFLPFLLLITAQGIRTVQLYKKYKQEQQAELALEREQIKQEREELMRIAEEIGQLRTQMAMDKQGDEE